MSQVSKSQQTTNAQVIRDETVKYANTKLRVYNALKDLIDSSIFWDQIKQVTGSSTTDVMSQKAVTDLVAGISLTLSSILTAGNDAGAKRIVNLADPSGAQDADTKAARDAADAAVVTQLVGGAGSGANTLKKLDDKIVAINAIIGGSAPDGDSLVNTVAELLAVFSTYPEGADVANALAGKLNTSDVYNALDYLIAGKALDARQGKALKDLIDTANTNIAAKANALNPTAVKTSSYAAAANDFIPTDASSASVPITLPAAPADKTLVAVKMIAVSGSFNTPITCGGTDVFNKTGGGTTITLSILNQGMLLQYKASGGIWYVVADDLSLAQLDLRYLQPSAVIGWQDLFIPASAMWPRVTAGCAVLAKTEIATSLVNIQSLDFDQATQEFAQFLLALPRNWDCGQIKAKVYWTSSAGTAAQGVVWGIKAGAYSDDDALSAALGAEVTITDAFITANDLHVTPESGLITVANSPADSDYLVIQISRNPVDASDTLASDAKLLGIVIILNTDAGKAA